MTHFLPLNLTFFLPVAFCVIAACAARILRTASTTAAVASAGPVHERADNQPA